MEVTAVTHWTIHGGIGECRGLSAQLTRLRLQTGQTVYVRENTGPRGGLAVHAGVRQGLKRGSNSMGQILELCCPGRFWDQVAASVRSLDPMGRQVVRNRNFTAAWAERQFDEAEAA